MLICMHCNVLLAHYGVRHQVQLTYMSSLAHNLPVDLRVICVGKACTGLHASVFAATSHILSLACLSGFYNQHVSMLRLENDKVYINLCAVRIGGSHAVLHLMHAHALQ